MHILVARVNQIPILAHLHLPESRTSQGIDGQFIHENYQILKVSATTGIDDSFI